MTNWDYVDGNDNSQGKGDGLRQYVKSLEDRIKASEAKAAQAEAAAEKAKLDSAFQSLGVPASVAGLYTGPKDADSAAQWVNDMRSAFGGNAPIQPQTQPVINDTSAYQRMTEAGSNSVPTSGLDDRQHAVNNADSLEDLFKAFEGLQ